MRKRHCICIWGNDFGFDPRRGVAENIHALTHAIVVGFSSIARSGTLA